MSFPTPSTMNTSKVSLATANAKRDGTDTTGVGFTAGGSGSTLLHIKIKAKGATTEGMVRGFKVFGGVKDLWIEQPIPERNAGDIERLGTYETVLTFEDEHLESGWTLEFSTQKAEQFAVHCVGEDY